MFAFHGIFILTAIVVDFPLNDSNCLVNILSGEMAVRWGEWVCVRECVYVWRRETFWLLLLCVLSKHRRHYWLSELLLNMMMMALLLLFVSVSFAFCSPWSLFFRCVQSVTHNSTPELQYIRYFEAYLSFRFQSHISILSHCLSPYASSSFFSSYTDIFLTFLFYFFFLLLCVCVRARSPWLPYLIFFDWCHNSNSICTLCF